MGDLTRTVPAALLITLLLVSAFLAWDRTGLLPWLSLLLCTGGLALIAFRKLQPAWIAASVIAVVGILWAGSTWYVFSNWESGEVVEVAFGDDVTIRTWVVEQDGEELIIYDCPPENIDAIENRASATLSRNGTSHDVAVRAVSLPEMGEDAFNAVFALYEEKYVTQSLATTVYYLSLGPRRGSMLYVLYLNRQ